MARKRMISPDIWGDDKFGQIDPFSQLIFIGLISQADDDGKFRSDPRLTRGCLLPYHTNVKVSKVAAALKEIEATGMIHLYETDGQRYGHLPNWKEHQTICHPTPSKIPDCPKCSISRNPLEDSRNSPEPSRKVLEPSLSNQVKSIQVSIGEDRLGQDNGVKHTPAESETSEKNDSKIFLPSSTDLDLTDRQKPDDYSPMTPDEVCGLFGEKNLPLPGRRKPRTNGNGVKAMESISAHFKRFEIMQGFERLRQQCRGPDDISDLPAYLLRTLEQMRSEDKYIKPCARSQTG